MSPAKPKFSQDALYQLLRDGDVKEFNRRRAAGELTDMKDCDFRALDLQGLDAKGLDMSGCYFRQADLRGIDFSKTNLKGASLNKSVISGALFPIEIEAQEIIMSVDYGTRMRYRPGMEGAQDSAPQTGADPDLIAKI